MIMHYQCGENYPSKNKLSLFSYTYIYTHPSFYPWTPPPMKTLIDSTILSQTSATQYLLQ